MEDIINELRKKLRFVERRERALHYKIKGIQNDLSFFISLSAILVVIIVLLLFNR